MESIHKLSNEMSEQDIEFQKRSPYMFRRQKKVCSSKYYTIVTEVFIPGFTFHSLIEYSWNFNQWASFS